MKAAAYRQRARSSPVTVRRLLTPASWGRTAFAVDLLVLQGSLAGVLLGAGRGVLARDGALAAAYSVCALGLIWVRGARRKRLDAPVFDSCVQVAGACSIAVMVALAGDSLLGGAPSVSSALPLWLVSVLSVCGARVLLHWIQLRARQHGALMSPTLIVGAGTIGAQLVRRLQERPELGLLPVGFLDADPMPRMDDLLPGVPVLGGPDDLLEVSERTRASHVILAFSSERDHRLVGLVKRCQALGLQVSVVPRLYESINEQATLDHLGGLPLLGLRPVDTHGWQFMVKHAIDRSVALVSLLLLAPALAAIALAVRLSSPGPVIFRQRRVGQDGRMFDMLKFRTMVQGGTLGHLKPHDGVAPGGVEGPDRRTRLGRWLRDTSLDELPQLVNVLRGEMSLVGPRPERPEFAERFAREVHGYKDRHRVKSGITGWAQVNGLRGQTSIADRAEWDNHYIENWSLGLELRTIGLTIAEVIRFREDKSVAQPRSQLDPGRSQSDAERSQLDPERSEPAPTPALALVEQAAASASPATWFCSYCGAAPLPDDVDAPPTRVCEQCGGGVLLETRSDVAPASGEAFLVIDPRLTVQALSMHAETVLGIREPEATDLPVSELLVSADSEGGSSESFATAVARAVSSSDAAYCAFVRPRGTFGVRLRARISYCGPPRAALIVLETPDEPPKQRHLQLARASPALAQLA